MRCGSPSNRFGANIECGLTMNRMIVEEKGFITCSELKRLTALKIIELPESSYCNALKDCICDYTTICIGKQECCNYVCSPQDGGQSSSSMGTIMLIIGLGLMGIGLGLIYHKYRRRCCKFNHIATNNEGGPDMPPNPALSYNIDLQNARVASTGESHDENSKPIIPTPEIQVSTNPMTSRECTEKGIQCGVIKREIIIEEDV